MKNSGFFFRKLVVNTVIFIFIPSLSEKNSDFKIKFIHLSFKHKVKKKETNKQSNKAKQTKNRKKYANNETYVYGFV